MRARPWEIGLAETQQTLVANDLRGRIWVQADGGVRTGRDVLIAALLGADEIGFATAPLIAAGCIMMRKCHLNTCPVGVATQDPELRKRFKGQPEHVINFFFFVAEELRELMASMGIRKFEDLVGKTEWLDTKKAISHWKAKGLDFGKLFAKADVTGPIATRRLHDQDHGLDAVLDRDLIAKAAPCPQRQEAGGDRSQDQEQQPHRWCHALRRSRLPLWSRRAAGRHDQREVHRCHRPELRSLGRAWRHPWT